MQYSNEHKLLFNQKNDMILNTKYLSFKEIFIEDYFKLLFERDGELQIQERGQEHYYNKAYNPIVLTLRKHSDGKLKNGKAYIVLKDLYVLSTFKNDEFAITAPVTYVGNKRNSNNARLLYGFTIDLDGVGLPQMRDLIWQMYNDAIPPANMLVNSGNGLHVYYLLKEPIPLFQNTQKILNDFKKDITSLIWNSFTSFDPNKQYQNILQGFRLPGSLTKFGAVVRAFQNINRDYWSFEELNKWFCDYHSDFGIRDEKTLNLLLGVKFETKDNSNLERAKKLYPEWYERRIIRGEKKGRWHVKRALYDWFLKKLQNESVAKVGHRYNCIMSLVLFAKKCDVPFEEVKKDAITLIEPFERITQDDTNHFTIEDVTDALKMYKEDMVTFPRNSIEYLTDIRFYENKRNGRKQKEHIKIMNLIRDNVTHINGSWINKEGRPKGSVIDAKNSPQAKKIKEWRDYNPNGNKSQCSRDLGLSRNTVRKWWDELI